MSVTCPTCNKQCASEGGLRNHTRLAHGQPFQTARAAIEDDGGSVNDELSEQLSEITGKTVIVVGRQPAAAIGEPLPKPAAVAVAAAAVAGNVYSDTTKPRHFNDNSWGMGTQGNPRNAVATHTRLANAVAAQKARKKASRAKAGRSVKLNHRLARKAG